MRRGIATAYIVIAVGVIAVIAASGVFFLRRKTPISGGPPPAGSMETGTGEGRKFVALGASITKGNNLSSKLIGDHPEYSFSTGTKIQSLYLFLKNGEEGLTAVNLAESGADSRKVLEQQVLNAISFRPKYVTVADLADILTESSPERFKKNLAEIVTKVKGEDTLVLVGSYPNFPKMRSASYTACKEDKLRLGVNKLTEEKILIFNRAIGEVAREKGIIFVDIYDVLGPEDVSDYDCLHPNISGQEKLAKRWIEILGAPPQKPSASESAGTLQKVEVEPPQAVQQPPQQTAGLSWQYGGPAITGNYADAEVVDLGDGRYRMYYSLEPEVSGFKGQMYSAVSSDGKSWVQDTGTRMEWATFPSVIKLPDGRYRIYFQNQGVIKSAISDDGLNWSDEAGVRIDAQNPAGLMLANVAAPTTMKIGDDYVMVYRGTINQKYPAQVPNQDTQLFLWAVSKDGLNFEKKGVALDSRNSVFKGLLDGPEFVKWDDGSVRLYFWSYRGIYHANFKSGAFSQNAQFDYTTSSDPRNQFPMNPPGDPTLARIGGSWFMYYGQHESGIYYAIYK